VKEKKQRVVSKSINAKENESKSIVLQRTSFYVKVITEQDVQGNSFNKA